MPLRPGHGPVPVGSPVAAAAATLTLLVVAGCGGSSGSDGSRASGGSGGSGGSSSSPDSATASCRSQWKALGAKVDGRDTATTPSTLRARWNSIATAIDYYAVSARSTDCGQALKDQEQAMGRLERFNARLAAYDLELTLDRLEAKGKTYAARKAPVRQRGRTGPAPRAVAAALRTLGTQAPAATRQQGPAWQQATATDPGDAKAVAKAVKDLRFLSSRSAAFEAGSAAASRVRTATSLLG